MFKHYANAENYLAAAQIVFVMIGMGGTLAFRDFASVLRHPRSLLVGLSWQYLIAPLITIAVISLFDLDPGISVGLILIASMPGGPLANVFTYLAKGNVALSVTMTTLATFASLVVTPLLLNLLTGGLIPDVQMPVGEIVWNTAVFVIVPLVGGMCFGRWSPAWSAKTAPWFVRAGVLVLTIMVVGSLGSGRIEPLTYGWGTPLLIIVLCLIYQNASMLLFLLCRWPVADQTAVGVGVTIRNVNLALLIASRLFPATQGHSVGGGVLYVCLFWGAVSLIVCVPTLYVQPRALEAEQQRLRA